MVGNRRPLAGLPNEPRLPPACRHGTWPRPSTSPRSTQQSRILRRNLVLARQGSSLDLPRARRLRRRFVRCGMSAASRRIVTPDFDQAGGGPKAHLNPPTPQLELFLPDSPRLRRDRLSRSRRLSLASPAVESFPARRRVSAPTYGQESACACRRLHRRDRCDRRGSHRRRASGGLRLAPRRPTKAPTANLGPALLDSRTSMSDVEQVAVRPTVTRGRAGLNRACKSSLRCALLLVLAHAVLVPSAFRRLLGRVFLTHRLVIQRPSDLKSRPAPEPSSAPRLPIAGSPFRQRPSAFRVRRAYARARSVPGRSSPPRAFMRAIPRFAD
jgi:hypothetical protein